MRQRYSSGLAIVLQAFGAVFGRTQAQVADVAAAEPSALAVSVYRAPNRSEGSINLDFLQGFALISETRQVRVPAGVSRLRFEGVADGIEAVSAIISGLPNGVLEKNRDAAVLSPAALITASVGKTVTLERTNRQSGVTEKIAGTLLSDADGGVVFQTPRGLEALRCSGLPETFVFEGDTGLAARPTLSVLVEALQPTTRTVTLSYLTRGFDWSADYTATLSADGKELAIGAWVTLANSNGVSFPDAQTQVIAGRVNHENGDLEPFALGGPILANCWPRGSSSDHDDATRMFKKGVLRFEAADAMKTVAASAALGEITVTAARRVVQEQLGDLKLYRIPDRTTVASRQSKQVRLLDRSGVPVATVYTADIDPAQVAYSLPAERLLRTTNVSANHLGVPLPSGGVAVFVERNGRPLLLHETRVRDLAVNEDVELSLGTSPDVQISVSSTATPDHVTRIEVSNAKTQDIDVELKVRLTPGVQILRADVAQTSKDGRPLFKLKVPGNSVSAFRFVSRTSESRGSVPASKN